MAARSHPREVIPRQEMALRVRVQGRERLRVHPYEGAPPRWLRAGVSTFVRWGTPAPVNARHHTEGTPDVSLRSGHHCVPRGGCRPAYSTGHGLPRVRRLHHSSSSQGRSRLADLHLPATPPSLRLVGSGQSTPPDRRRDASLVQDCSRSPAARRDHRDASSRLDVGLWHPVRQPVTRRRRLADSPAQRPRLFHHDGPGSPPGGHRPRPPSRRERSSGRHCHPARTRRNDGRATPCSASECPASG
jgi:hypothetical protein